MRIVDYQDLPTLYDEKTPRRDASVTIGVFDGIHRGHMLLLQKVTENPDLESIVITFHENPKKILRPDTFHGCILTERQKLEHLKAHGIDTVILIDFSADFSKLRGDEFFTFVAQHIPMVKLVVGSNFRCGINASFDAEKIKEFFYGSRVDAQIVERLVHDKNKKISSSYVRRLIKAGRMGRAAELLDRTYSLDLSKIPIEMEEGRMILHPGDVVQLLPPPGLYRISLGQDPSNYFSTLTIEHNRLVVDLDWDEWLESAWRELNIIEKIDDR